MRHTASRVGSLPDGLQLVQVSVGTDERRRLLVARLPGDPAPAVDAVLRVLRDPGQT